MFLSVKFPCSKYHLLRTYLNTIWMTLTLRNNPFTLYGFPFLPDNLKVNILHFLIISFWCFQSIKVGSFWLHKNYLLLCQRVSRVPRSHGCWYWCVYGPVSWDIPVYNTSLQSKSLFASYTQLDNFVIYLHLYVHYDVFSKIY